jgi:hypothetical protein
MVALDLRHVAALLSAFALVVAVPLGRMLSRWSQRHLHATESFAGGLSLAYVVLDLTVELTGAGSKEVHAVVPIGPTHQRSVFALVLVGATLWLVVAALAMQVGGHRSRYLTYSLPQAAYRAVVGGALGHESEHGSTPLVFFAIPMLLHLTVLESRIHRQFQSDHTGVVRWFVAMAPGLAATAWTLLGLPEAPLFVALALVAGTTVVQIIQTELPWPKLIRLGPFLAGVCLYSVLIAMRWAL